MVQGKEFMQFTGERVVEGETPTRIWLDHIARYEFAAGWVKEKKVLDIACGTGYGSRFLFDQGAKTVKGIDIDEKSIKYAQQRYGCTGLEFVVGDALAIESTTIFDVVVSFETIEHLSDPKGFIQSVLSVLDKSGIFIVSTPNRLVTSPGKSFSENCDNPFHKIEYTKKEFSELLKKFFSTVEIYGQRENHKIKVFLVQTTRKIMGNLFPQSYILIDGLPTVKKVSSYYEPRYLVAVCSFPRK